ncbi:MAG: site-2 protease family protein [Bacillota bacterium]
MRFQLRGVVVEVHPLFLITLILFWTGRGGVEVGIFLFSLAIHELGHLAVLTGQGLGVARVELLPFGSVITPLAPTLEPGEEFMVAAAGPLHSLVLVATGWLAAPRVPNPDLASWFLELNATLGVFNLLPLLPLDGGRMLRARWALSLGWRRATWRLIRLGRWGSGVLTAVAVVALLQGRMLVPLLVLAWVLLLAAGQEEEWGMYRFLRHVEEKHRRLRWRGFMPSAGLVATPQTRLLETVRQFLPHRYHVVLVVDRGEPLGLLTEEQVWEGLRASPSATLADILKRQS